MEQLCNVPTMEADSIEQFIKQNGLAVESDGNKGGRQTRSSAKKTIENIIVEELEIDKIKQTVTGLVKEVPVDVGKIKKKKATEDKKLGLISHKIMTEINKADRSIKSACCEDCDNNKVKCTKISAFLLWLQQKQKEHQQEVENSRENHPKKIKRERNGDNVLKPVNMVVVPVKIELPSLAKLKIEPIQASPLEMEAAKKLSLFNLIREYQGNDPNEFLQFCSKRMQEENCSNAQILTIQQADTDLWHDLRKGRITASRIHEASRCSMLNGSLTNKIMGISSGFSFAMKRGTDLEGHVFAVLKKEYPSLRNTGLVLDPQFPWMGASPDGISDDFVLEIKCPYTPKTYECYIDVKKLSKKYFGQIQLQMQMTHMTKALLGVAALDFEKTRNVTKVWIDYDKEYVDEVMEHAFEYWRKGVFPALVRKRKSKK